MDGSPLTDELAGGALPRGNPHRIRIVARLAEGRDYVSRLAREVGISRPLLHMHLQRLEEARLIVGTLELGEGGKVLKFVDLAPFGLVLKPQ